MLNHTKLILEGNVTPTRSPMPYKHKEDKATQMRGYRLRKKSQRIDLKQKLDSATQLLNRVTTDSAKSKPNDKKSERMFATDSGSKGFNIPVSELQMRRVVGDSVGSEKKYINAEDAYRQQRKDVNECVYIRMKGLHEDFDTAYAECEKQLLKVDSPFKQETPKYVVDELEEHEPEPTPLEKCAALRMNLCHEGEEEALAACRRMFAEPYVKRKTGLAALDVFEDEDYSDNDWVMKAITVVNAWDEKCSKEADKMAEMERVTKRLQRRNREDMLTVGDLHGKTKEQIIAENMGTERKVRLTVGDKFTQMAEEKERFRQCVAEEMQAGLSREEAEKVCKEDAEKRLPTE